MFIDASALTALLTDEDEARELLARLQQTGTRLTSPLAVWEAAVAVARVLGLSVSVAEPVEGVERYPRRLRQHRDHNDLHQRDIVFDRLRGAEKKSVSPKRCM